MFLTKIEGLCEREMLKESGGGEREKVEGQRKKQNIRAEHF